MPSSVRSPLDRHDVGRRLIFGDVLVAGQHPRDAVQVDAVLVLQDAARPQAGRDGVAAIDADLLAFEILRGPDARLRVVEDGAMMKRAHRKHRDGREPFSVRLRA